MASGERTIADVLHDIAGNIQHIVRAEVRLAKAELREDMGKAKSAAALLACGAVAGSLGLAFLLLAVVWALATAIAPWAAALIVGLVTAAVAGICVMTASKALKDIGVPRTAETIREDIQWAKTRVK